MRTVLAGIAVILPVAGLFAQTLAPAPPAVQRVIVTASTSSASAAPGATVSLWADVTPKPAIHVYAPGATDFQIVTLVITPQRGVAPGKPVYPAGTPIAFAGTPGRVPVYQKLFRITQPVTIAKAVTLGQTLTIAGAVNYQACDDRVCFPPASVPVMWTLGVR